MARKKKTPQESSKELIKKKDAALELSASIIRSNKKDLNSDINLIESLNRYIATLETKIKYQDELITEQREMLREQREHLQSLATPLTNN